MSARPAISPRGPQRSAATSILPIPRRPTLLKLSAMLRSKSLPPFLILLSLLLTAGTVYTQFSVYDARYLAESEAGRQRAVIGRAAPSPRQYRVLSAWLIEGFHRAGRAIGVSSPVPSFLIPRVLQNLAIFLLAALWYRRLIGPRPSRIAWGLIFLAWGMSYAFRDGGLDFSVYSSTILCLLAALAVSSGRDLWIIPITLAAALNRSTAFVIPLAYLACRFRRPIGPRSPGAKALLVFSLSLSLWLGVFLGLRLHFGWKPLDRVWLQRPGLDLLLFNYRHSLTWAKLVWTLNVLPLACLFSWRNWPSELKRWSLVLLPAVFLVVPCYQWLSETRAVLAPLAVVFVPGALLLEKSLSASRNRRGAIAALVVALTLATVYAQSWLLWPRYLRESQLERHREVMENRACNPWQYRVLSEVVSEGLLRLSGLLRVSSPVPAFLLFRILQNAAIFLLAAAYYRRIILFAPRSGMEEPPRLNGRTASVGPFCEWADKTPPRRGGLQSHSEWIVVLGLIALAWGMTYATYNSDLHFSTYTEIILYLLALHAVGGNRDRWIPPLALLAALNRETSVFIPLFFLLSRIRWRGIRPALEPRSAGIFLASASLYAAAYLGLHWGLGWRSFIASWGAPGFARLLGNLAKGSGWQYLFLTVNALPLLAIASFRRWPRRLADAGSGIALPWLVAHYAGKACLEETRFLLLPLAIVFIPGALLLMMVKDNKDARDIKD